MAPITYELQLDFAKVLGEGLFYGALITLAWFPLRDGVSTYQEQANRLTYKIYSDQARSWFL